MTLAGTAYFMSLAGGAAGLLSWATITVLSFFVIQDRTWSDLTAKILLGGFLGGMTMGFQDHWAGNPVLKRWIALGVLLGVAAGLVAGIVQIPIDRAFSDSAPLANRVIAWTIAGSFIGMALGLRWISANPTRVALSLVGGLAGGAVGGLLVSLLGASVVDLSAALSYVLVGIGIACGCTVAATLLRTGFLEFVSSGDPHTQDKLSRTQPFWELRDGDSYLIGNRAPAARETQFRPQTEIWLPDPRVAPRHARVYARQGRFFVARHGDISEVAAMARYVLKVRGNTVLSSQQLAESDDILIGRTTLRFSSTRRTVGG
jgi:hypothetical protein